MKITTDAFEAGGRIPGKYTCEGDDISPALHIREVPDEAQSLALIFDDPDAPNGTFTHWVIYNLSPDTRELNENVPEGAVLKNEIYQGRNDFGNTGYGGPCPPQDTKHRYYFRLYALDEVLTVGPGITRNELIKAMEDHTVDQSELMVTFSR